MKYLKLFEDKEKNEFSQEDLDYCFSELIDDGFKVVKTINNLGRSSFYICKNSFYLAMNTPMPLRYNKFSFNFSEIKEVLLFAIPYMKQEYDFDRINMDAILEGGKKLNFFNINEETINDFEHHTDSNLIQINLIFCNKFK